jgi:hypothetical protein
MVNREIRVNFMLDLGTFTRFGLIFNELTLNCEVKAPFVTITCHYASNRNPQTHP